MLKYLIVQLDDTAPSFCHYPNDRKERTLIPLETLKKALVWGMKENVIFQFVYPDYELPEEYKSAISSVYRADIVSSGNPDKALSEDADIVVLDSWKDGKYVEVRKDTAYVVRATFAELLANVGALKSLLTKVDRLTVMPLDVESYTDSMNGDYSALLDSLADTVRDEFVKGHAVQFNLLTDRILLDKMNNCNAGVETLTLAPDGKFYVCPAFYLCEDGYAVGDIENGPRIPNQQLYTLGRAPVCRECDAWQCRRCVWLNRRLTLEVNTPGHQQCVISHLERNASRELLKSLKEKGILINRDEISLVDYLDPISKFVN